MSETYMVAGETYNLLTSLEGAAGSQDMIWWRCTCGNEKQIRATSVRCGITKSCGCLQGKAARGNLNNLRNVPNARNYSKHELYGTWHNMLTRTTNPKHTAWKWYGARGIKVCPQWHDAETFYADIARLIGPRPQGMTLDRIDNNGNYEPGNVRWATASDQARNQRKRKHARPQPITAKVRIALLEAEVARLQELVRVLQERSNAV